MICGRCQKQEARVHVTEIVGSEMTKLHLCEVCFRETHPEPPPPLPLLRRKFAWGRTEVMTAREENLQEIARKKNLQEIRALDCKNNPEHFERMLGWVLEQVTKDTGVTLQELYECVPEASVRDALRKAIYMNDGTRWGITTFVRWFMKIFLADRISAIGRTRR